jgi:hypothetical protein
MTDPDPADLRPSLAQILANPIPDDLWQFQKALLVVGGPEAARARGVARAFQSCLRTLESKSASRTASRWGAVLGTAAVASVSLPEMRDRQERGLGELLERALPAVLEIGAAMQSAQAWEIEAGLVYDEFGWFLYEELWDISLGVRAELTPVERPGASTRSSTRSWTLPSRTRTGRRSSSTSSDPCSLRACCRSCGTSGTSGRD